MTSNWNLATVLGAILAAGEMPKRKPTREELAEFDRRCCDASLAELGHLLFTAETEQHRQVAERVAKMRIGAL
ncbi:MAG: hypothetical protein MUC36_10370 [Planctomycetes bacterium]|jgi:hypothetical protein|nr:hypothetical protein [Planctomycetota bacterium]